MTRHAWSQEASTSQSPVSANPKCHRQKNLNIFFLQLLRASASIETLDPLVIPHPKTSNANGDGNDTKLNTTLA